MSTLTTRDAVLTIISAVPYVGGAISRLADRVHDERRLVQIEATLDQLANAIG